MTKSRVSPVGRRLLMNSIIDEKDIPITLKPGFTFGISTRSTPKDWDYTAVKLWPKCSYEPVQRCKTTN
jgi:hypothetical protein